MRERRRAYGLTLAIVDDDLDDGDASEEEAETKAKEKKRLEKLSDDERAKAELEKVQKDDGIFV